MGIKKEQYAEALRICHGVKSRAAHLLGVTPGTITQVCKKWPELQQIVDDAVWELLDEGQYQLFRKLKEGDPKAIDMVHKYYGHLRGLIPVKDITSKGQRIGDGSQTYDRPERIQANIAILLHNPSAMALLKKLYLEIENNADRNRLIDAEFSSVGTTKPDRGERS